MVSGQKNLIWNRRDENNRQVSPGNYRSEIEAISAYDQTIIETAAEFYLPLYYWQNSGGEKNDDEFLIQGNPQSFGTSPTEKLNRHKQSVIYKFENLKAESEYGIAFEFYSPAGEKRIQNVTAAALEIISNIQFSKEPVRTGFVKLPPESYSSGDITISINSRDDNDAVVSQVWIKETGVQFSVNHLDENLPKTYNLEQNYPNPFNPSTTISFFLPHSQKVELSVYDILGRRVAKLVNEWKNAGSYNINFDASHLASGVYIYRLKAGKFSQSRKMLLVR